MTAIDEVKQKADIVDVMSQYNVKLEKMGRNYKALCPFHSEKHASFFVFPDQQRWHCFGACATGGDVISFVMKREGLDFSPALHLLADRAGVKLSQASREHDSVRDRLFTINGSAADFFHHTFTSTRHGENARAYLEKRGVSTSSISAFQIGYSPDGWDTLKNHLLSHDYAENDLLSAGLVVDREGQGHYDRFRNRLMFPIRDAQGRITGFGGRALDDSLPKYMNSPQTAIFDKSSTVYGVDRAKAAIKRENRVVIVEGYMDVIMAHQYGFENVVASMGTSLTEKQTVILQKLTNRFTLALDSDAAGTEATLRGIETVDRALSSAVTNTGRTLDWKEYAVVGELTVISLPPGKDPDEVIKQDPSAWSALVANAVPAMGYVLALAASRVDLKERHGRAELVNRMLPVIAQLSEPVRRSDYLQELAQLAHVKEEDLRSKLRRIDADFSQKPWTRHKPQVSSSPVSSDRRVIEHYCAALLLQNPDLKIDREDLSLDYFDDIEVREVILRWLDCRDRESLQTVLDPSLADTLNRLLAKNLPPAKPSERRHHLDDCIQRLKERWLRDLEQKKADVLLEAEVEGSEVVVENLRQQGNTISERLNKLFHQPKGRQRLKKEAS